MNFFGLPIGAGQNDPVVGEVDGAKIRQAPDGTRYYEQYQPPVAPVASPLMLQTTMDAQGRATHDRVPNTTRDKVRAMIAPVEMLAGEAWRGVAAPGRALRGEPVTYGDAWATALDWGALSAPTSAPQGALRAGGMGADTPKGIRAYHGSPHDFDRFSLDKMGTGEGMQAYGDGLYFAESEDVARAYRDDLSRGVTAGGKDYQFGLDAADAAERAVLDAGLPREIAENARWYINRGYSPQVFIDDVAKRDPEAAQRISGVLSDSSNPGRVYEVNINANPDDFLDWDAPLSDQPQKVRDVYNSLDGRPDVTGADIYRSLAEEGDAGTWMGAPGIKFKDAFSRGAEGGTRNFVVFDDSLIEIVRKYGIAGAAAYLGMPEDEIRERIGGT